MSQQNLEDTFRIPSPSHLPMSDTICPQKKCSQLVKMHRCIHPTCTSVLSHHKALTDHIDGYHTLTVDVTIDDQSITLTRLSPFHPLQCSWPGCDKSFRNKKMGIKHVKEEHFQAPAGSRRRRAAGVKPRPPQGSFPPAAPPDPSSSIPDEAPPDPSPDAAPIPLEDRPGASQVMQKDPDDDEIILSFCRPKGPLAAPAQTARHNAVQRPPPAPVAPVARATMAPIATLANVEALKALEDMKEGLKCSICQDLFLDPRAVLACGHSFCGQCIFTWCDSHSKATPAGYTSDDDDEHPPIPCPTCRKPLPSVDDLWRNFALDYAVELFISTLRRYGSPAWQKGGTLTKERAQKLIQWKQNAYRRQRAMEDPADSDYKPSASDRRA